MRGYYINLDRSTDRRRKMEERMLPLFPGLTRMKAATPDDVPADYRKPEALADDNAFESQNQGAPGYKMRTAAVGCSHMRCWRAVLDGEEDGAFVFEDDVVPNKGFQAGLKLFEAHPDRPLFDLIYVNQRSFAYYAHLLDGLVPRGDFVTIEMAFTILRGSRMRPTDTKDGRIPPTGLDGYYVTKRAAETLLKVYDEFDEYYTNDWTVLGVTAAGLPQQYLQPKVRKVLHEAGLIDAVRKVGSVKGAFFTRPLVKLDKELPSVRLLGAEGEPAPESAPA